MYTQYQEITQKAADLNNAAAVLGWDQETYMPPKAYAVRGRQLSTLASQAHTLLTSDTYCQLLKSLKGPLSEDEAANVRLSQEDYDKAACLPASFVEALTQASSAAMEAWMQARKQNDYQIFAPALARMVDLKKQQAKLYGYEEHPYDALLDDYEKGATVKMLDGIFDELRMELPPLLAAIASKPAPDDQFFSQHFPKQDQWDFSLEVLKAMGYDFEAGRQDYSEHPFTTSFGPTDVRITTRVSEQNLASLLWSSIHEGGHALYEQGLPEDQYGMPLGMAASLSIHESQSRLWENGIGRSYDFWSHFYPILQARFPEQLKATSLDSYYAGMNRVESSLIRTEADELTYHFHVMIRYEIEKGLMENSIAVKDLPEVWNSLYQKYLGITHPDAVQGILQDVHWSHGSFGYFPTYSLGSFYAAQFLDAARIAIPELPVQIGGGNFKPLLAWLRKEIHQYGRKYRSAELCRRITGQEPGISAFMNYSKEKYRRIYQLNKPEM